ncbi:TPA: hypothetical protein NKW13_004373 [Vibrio parahaemolyticus]|uniref:hypothetical protein n=1 Tax=Vibrio parahaemolyticus TaxID=670 RepID=UPI001E2B9107|nr:hypothetical protein [Vibrio parahaemolyticus]HCE2641708.1 hypothetical protein [Vibrio parahaemolyticus]HCH4213713.1 hypothetical protein [Vibrio parahaemolyticus]
MINFKDIKGYPCDNDKSEELAKLEDATKVLNDWLIKNPEIQIVNIESIYSHTGAMMGSTDSKFSKLRVWYK